MLFAKSFERPKRPKSIWSNNESNLDKDDLADLNKTGLNVTDVKLYLQDLGYFKAEEVRKRFPLGRGSFYGSFSE